MRTFFQISILIILTSCVDNPIARLRTDTFTYFDADTKGTLKFYCYSNIDTALYHAKKEKKNILTIFSCWGCMAMGNEEWKTLSLYPDLNKLHDKFILLWLPNDDRRIADDTNQIVFWYHKNRRLKTVGDQNKYFEETVFGQSTQPVFCFMDSLKRPLGKILGYTKNKADVESFVDSGHSQ